MKRRQFASAKVIPVCCTAFVRNWHYPDGTQVTTQRPLSVSVSGLPKTSAVELSLTFVKAAKLAIGRMTNSPIGVTTSDWTQGGGRSQIHG